MPTAVKTWVFASDAEGLADSGNHASLTFAFLSSDGSPASGCVRFTTTASSLSGAVERARRASTGETWESWGVSSGGTVTNVQVTAWKRNSPTVQGATSRRIRARVIGSGGAAVHSGGDLLDVLLPGLATAGWIDESAGTQQAVDAGSQASTTDVRLELEWVVSTGSGRVNLNDRLDTIELTITYSAGAVHGAASLAGVALQSASGIARHHAGASMAGVGVQSASGVRHAHGAASAAAVAAWAASGIARHHAGASLDGVAVQSASGRAAHHAAAAASGVAVQSASGIRGAHGAASLAGIAAQSAAGNAAHHAGASAAGIAQAAAAGVRHAHGAASAAGAAVLTAAAGGGVSGASALVAVALQSASGVRHAHGGAPAACVAAWAASGRLVAHGAASMTGVAAVGSGLKVFGQALYDRIEWYPGCGDVFGFKDGRYGHELLAAAAKIIRGQVHGLVLSQNMAPLAKQTVSVTDVLSGEPAGTGISGSRGEYQTGLPYGHGKRDHAIQVQRESLTEKLWSRKRTRAAFRTGAGAHRAIEVDSPRGWLHVGDVKRIRTYHIASWTLAFESADYDVDEWHGLRADPRWGRLLGVSKKGADEFKVWTSEDGGQTGTVVLSMTATSAAIERDSERGILVVLWENGGTIQRQASQDGGATWSSAQAVAGMSGTILDMSQDPRWGSMQLALLQSGSFSVWVSDDLGETWTQKLT